METIIVNITLGALGKTVEFILPAHVPIQSLMDGILRRVSLTFWNAAYDETALLYSMEDRKPLQPQWTLAQCGVYERAALMLI